MTNPSSFHKDVHAFRLPTHIGATGVGLWDSAYLTCSLSLSTLQKTRPNVTKKNKDKMVQGLGWGMGPAGNWLPACFQLR